MRNCKCSNCGTEYEIADDQEPICPGCGERVNNDNQEETVKNCGDEESITIASIKNKKQNKNMWIWIVGVCAVFVGVILIILNSTSVICINHKWKEATCAEPKVCNKCGKIVGEALGHQEGEWQIIKEPTLTENGTEKLRCVRCGLDLDSQEVSKKEPDVNSEGFNFTGEEFSNLINYIFASNENKTEKSIFILAKNISDESDIYIYPIFNENVFDTEGESDVPVAMFAFTTNDENNIQDFAVIADDQSIACMDGIIFAFTVDMRMDTDEAIYNVLLGSSYTSPKGLNITMDEEDDGVTRLNVMSP